MLVLHALKMLNDQEIKNLKRNVGGYKSEKVW